MAVKHLSEDIWVIEDFISEQKCHELILFSEQLGYGEATVTTENGARMMKGVRDNYRIIHKDAQLAYDLWPKLAPHCPSTVLNLNLMRLNDHFRFYRYSEGQRFKRHRDGRVQLPSGETSLITFMVYLNEDFEGGETQFDEVVVKPKAGMALCFFHNLKHEGRPILSGEKYVLRSDVFYFSSNL